MKNIAVVCGGYSGESVVSMRSAKMVMENIDRSKFEPTQIVIEQKRWFALVNEAEVAVDRNDFSVLVNGAKVMFDYGRSPGLLVMIGYSCLEGCEFESQHRILDGLLVTFIS